jgi:hypothetical protein
MTREYFIEEAPWAGFGVVRISTYNVETLLAVWSGRRNINNAFETEAAKEDKTIAICEKLSLEFQLLHKTAKSERKCLSIWANLLTSLFAPMHTSKLKVL